MIMATILKITEMNSPVRRDDSVTESKVILTTGMTECISTQ
jgi:hypothetical protein